MPNQTSPETSFEEILNMQFERSSRKSEKSFGLQFVKSFWSNSYAGTGSYFDLRNKQYKESEDLANGIIDVEKFKSYLGVENNKSWNNLDWSLLKIIPRYVQSLIGSFMNREEKPDVSAIDILSQQFKAREKQLSKYRMQEKERIAQMQAMAGKDLQLEDGFTPQDEDELELYYKLQYRLPEEMFFGKTIEEIFQNSDYQTLKRQLIGDLVKKNLAATKIEQVNASSKTLGNRLFVRRCKPDRTIYNVFESPIGRDVSIIGEAYPIDIAEGRKRFPKVTEEEWHKLAEISSKGRNLINTIGPWKYEYLHTATRPYDTFKFDIFDFEVKSADTDWYVSAPNATGQEMLIKKKGKPAPQNGEIIEDTKMNIYCGTWAIDTDIMLHWGKAENIIRPYQNGFDCFFNYSIVSPDANGGLVPSILERGVSIVKQMIICSLKIQQMMLEMRPDGIAMDIAGLHSVDVGLGEGNELQPMEVKRIYKQTGDVIWDSGNTDGVAGGDAKSIPFQTIQNGGNAAQINTLIGTYNFWLQRLNDEWATNPDALGQPVPSRRSVKVNENMIQASNQTVEYIYDHFCILVEHNGSKLAMKLWDTIIFESEDYKKMDGMSESLMEAVFDVNINMIPTHESRQRLQNKIDIALEKGVITLGQSIRLENMDNIKDAELYLIKLEKTAEQNMAAAKQQDYQNNAALQKDAAQGKAQADASTVAAKAQAESLVSTSKANDAAYLEIVKMVTALQVDAQANGKPISDQNMALSTTIINSIMQKQAQAVAEEQQEGIPEEEPQEQMA